MIKFYPHQIQELSETFDLSHVAYYHDMGLGKTFTGGEKLHQLGAKVNLVVCQKSKVDDWIEHLSKYYDDWIVYDGTKQKCLRMFMDYPFDERQVLVINYELAFRRPELLKLKDFSLMLDESSLIQNENAKRSKFILKLQPKNVILLSGTPTSGRYETLWTQLHLLGWGISKDLYWKQYIDVEVIDNQGFPIKVVKGYKNVDRLKAKMRQYGCRFLKTEEVFDLPEQNFQQIKINTTKEYRKFKKDRIVVIDDKQLVGDTVLTKMLYERMLCGHYNPDKLRALKDIMISTENRLIVFTTLTMS